MRLPKKYLTAKFGSTNRPSFSFDEEKDVEYAKFACRVC